MFFTEFLSHTLDDLSASGYHLIIEGTLRTTEVPLRARDLLRSRGYDVSLNLILVRPEESYLGTLKRYQQMKEIGLTPRMTPKEHQPRGTFHRRSSAYAL